jgi:hypothetical protein
MSVRDLFNRLRFHNPRSPRQSPFSSTIAVLLDNRRSPRQSPFSSTITVPVLCACNSVILRLREIICRGVSNVRQRSGQVHWC